MQTRSDPTHGGEGALGLFRLTSLTCVFRGFSLSQVKPIAKASGQRCFVNAFRCNSAVSVFIYSAPYPVL
jgi:hypothetical protein